MDTSSFILSEKYNRRLLASYDMVFDTDSGKIFWTNSITHQILCSKYPDTSVNVLNVLVSVPVDLDIDHVNHKLYWADNRIGALYRANLDGTQEEALTTNTFGDLSSVAVYATAKLLFYADLDSITIWSSSLNGQNPSIIMRDTVGFPIRLVIDTIKQKLYWSDDGLHRIERINFDGTDREIFYQGEANELPFGLFIDQSKSMLYWTDYGTNQILQADLDRKEKIPIITSGLDVPVAIGIFRPGVEYRSNTKSEIPDQNFNSILVYPNPANNFLTFSSIMRNTFIDKIQVFDNVGKQVFNSIINQRTFQMDLQPYSEGYYSYIITTGGKLIVGHFSIIH